eukprot:symbB.v1.2.013276.t1/scaffold879.1/size325971/23
MHPPPTTFYYDQQNDPWAVHEELGNPQQGTGAYPCPMNPGPSNAWSPPMQSHGFPSNQNMPPGYPMPCQQQNSGCGGPAQNMAPGYPMPCQQQNSGCGGPAQQPSCKPYNLSLILFNIKDLERATEGQMPCQQQNSGCGGPAQNMAPVYPMPCQQQNSGCGGPAQNMAPGYPMPCQQQNSGCGGPAQNMAPGYPMPCQQQNSGCGGPAQFSPMAPGLTNLGLQGTLQTWNSTPSPSPQGQSHGFPIQGVPDRQEINGIAGQSMAGQSGQAPSTSAFWQPPGISTSRPNSQTGPPNFGSMTSRASRKFLKEGSVPEHLKPPSVRGKSEASRVSARRHQNGNGRPSVNAPVPDVQPELRPTSESDSDGDRILDRMQC